MHFYELHMHTAETSRCGQSPAADMVRAYKEKGFTGVVVTDHFVNGNCYARDVEGWQEKIDIFMRGYNAAKAEGDKIGLKVYFGLEFTYHGAGGEDYLTLGLTEAHLRRELAGCTDWTLEEYVEAVHKLGGIVIRAHPYRRAFYIDQPGLWRPGLPIDAIEVFNGGNKAEDFNRLALEMALRENLPMTAGSDTHHVDTTATDYVGFEEDPADYAALCRMIRERKTFLVHKTKQEYVNEQ